MSCQNSSTVWFKLCIEIILISILFQLFEIITLTNAVGRLAAGILLIFIFSFVIKLAGIELINIESVEPKSMLWTNDLSFESAIFILFVTKF